MLTQNRLRIDDVLGLWPLHGVCGAWGGIAAGIFGTERPGGLGGVSLLFHLIGTLAGIVIALVAGFLIYGVVKIKCWYQGEQGRRISWCGSEYPSGIRFSPL